tara:strand:- start:269 stop:1072 length:804 start_codon:yes stop_codon:yes gene_type:complete
MSNLTILSIAYKPRIELVDRLIENFASKYPILIINNSLSKLNDDFYHRKNVKIIDNELNLGNGAGINLGLKKIKTKYVLYLDFDSFIDTENLRKLDNHVKKLKDFAVLIPNSTGKKQYAEPYKTWKSEGSIMLFNLEIIRDKILFDEKYFLYFEETDFFFNCLKKNLDVFFLPDVTTLHSQGSSSVEDVKIENLRTWHYSWSQFYFYKKNFGTYYAYSKCFPFFFKDIIMLIAYTLTFKSKLFKFRFYRISGFLNSLIGLRSWKRIK